MPKITVIGGGTGSPIVATALQKAHFTNISCIVASMDSGGKTGAIRSDERDQVIAISDLLRTLISLITTSNHQKNIDAFIDLISFTDGRHRNLGYSLYYGLLEKYQNDFIKVQKHLENLLGIRFGGTAIPITTESSNIVFSTKNKAVYNGEHELDKQLMSKNTIKEIWLDRPVQATPQAQNAIKNADFIIYSPGSLYGSVISNFLPEGITAALKESKACKILITNLVSNRNQTHRFTLTQYLSLFRRYTKLKIPFDCVVIPKITSSQFEKRYPKVAKAYSLEHAHFLGFSSKDRQNLENKGIKIYTSDILSITSQFNRLRHDSNKLAQVLSQIIKKTVSQTGKRQSQKITSRLKLTIKRPKMNNPIVRHKMNQR